MSWEPSASQGSKQQRSNPQISTSTIPLAKAWRVAKAWSVSLLAQEKPSIRFPSQMGSANGRYSLLFKACLQKMQFLRTVLLPRQKVKVSSRNAAVQALQGTLSMKTVKCQPLKHTPSPSVKMGRTSKGLNVPSSTGWQTRGSANGMFLFLLGSRTTVERIQVKQIAYCKTGPKLLRSDVFWVLVAWTKPLKDSEWLQWTVSTLWSSKRLASASYLPDIKRLSPVSKFLLLRFMCNGGERANYKVPMLIAAWILSDSSTFRAILWFCPPQKAKPQFSSWESWVWEAQVLGQCLQISAYFSLRDCGPESFPTPSCLSCLCPGPDLVRSCMPCWIE